MMKIMFGAAALCPNKLSAPGVSASVPRAAFCSNVRRVNPASLLHDYAILVRKLLKVEVSMKMPKLRTLLAAYAGLILSAVPVLAHHSFAAEYESKEVTLTGIITKVEWTNPHIYFYIDVKDAEWQRGQLGRGRLSSEYLEADRVHRDDLRWAIRSPSLRTPPKIAPTALPAGK